MTTKKPKLGSIPLLLLPAEMARLLRCTRAAVYARAARGALPGVVHVGPRLLFNRDAVLAWLHAQSAL